MVDLAGQFKEALTVFSRCATPPALIGGLAIAAHGVIRATQDVDFLVDSTDGELLHELVLGLGYKCLYRSAEAANYRRGEEGLDFLYARRPIARRLLSEAPEHETDMGRVRIVSAEGLIGFKLQAHINNPARQQDLHDIRELLRIHSARLDMDEVRGYFRMFQREAMLDELTRG
jgi:hypothetical protein